ncbi:UNVERIFIED_CONTAM: DNA-3-methyladenine glycosylase 1 [Sesamum radiatum]|uniref:DNA-3-methyladenine glycosylase 1 n=1 Tax=Sesamum radiatum TaxID=300843 RepID=A0AAW2VPK4_SESRA
MSGPPMLESMNFAEPEDRPVLGPAGNKARSVELRKPILKPKSEKTRQSPEADKGKKSPAALQSPEITTEKIPSPVGFRRNAGSAASILRQRQPNLSLNASCSSDASTDSSHSRASTGRIGRRTGTSIPPLKKKQQCSPRGERIEKLEGNGKSVGGEGDGVEYDGSLVKKRCAWVTSNTGSGKPWLLTTAYQALWSCALVLNVSGMFSGVLSSSVVKLFELLSFSTALAELTWPVILGKRTIFRDVFLDFDPIAVSKLNDKKIATQGSPASSLLSELKLRAIIENARQICKIIDEVGSFDKYIWGFVNYKPIVGNFRYPRQVPIKTSKADTISKDLVRRGFRGVGPTVVYSFMQVAGITNDHLINCFRYQDCIVAGDLRDKNEGITSKNEENPPKISESWS